MTEDELMTAIHAHELHVKQCQLLRQEPTDEARAKLLEALEAWAVTGAESQHGYLARLFEHYAPQCEPLTTVLGVCTQIDNLLATLPILRAKEAVCDAYRDWDYDQIHDERADLRDALSTLRRLENKP